MERKFNWVKFLLRGLSYVLVAAITLVITLAIWGPRQSKLTELLNVIDQVYVDEYDLGKIEDAAAKAMVAALPDGWSFYLTAEEWSTYQETINNFFVGVGITIEPHPEGIGEIITVVNEDGPAHKAGVCVDDVIIKVDDRSIAGMSTAETRELVIGEKDTKVKLTILRGDQEMEITVTRGVVSIPAATGTMLENNIGLIRIVNFNNNSAKDVIAAIEKLQTEGATALVFDVRHNPGGYVREMVDVLDYLLPECVVFREMDYKGNEREALSDAACVDLPMAVLVNADSYSAAEFFAACLQEYDKAIVVGEKTVGKGYYQNSVVFSDGSAVNISTGKYFTPSGINLTEQGGLTPDIPLTVYDEIAVGIAAGTLDPKDDPQLQAAIGAILGANG